MPLGVYNTHPTFPRSLNILRNRFHWHMYLIYLNTVLFFMKSFDAYPLYMGVVLSTLWNAGILRNLGKFCLVMDGAK